MTDKKKDLYIILIIYFCFLIIKKSLDLYMEIKIPVYEVLSNKSSLFKDVFKIRDVFTFISMFFILYIITYYKTNIYINTIFLLIFISNIFFLLVEERYIYYFVDKKKLNINDLQFLDKNLGRFSTLVIFLYCFYVIISIFYKPK